MRISIKCSWPQLWAAILEGTQSWQCFPCSCQLLMLSRIHEPYFRSFTRLLWKPAFHPEWKKKKSFHWLLMCCVFVFAGFGDGKYVSFQERQWHQPCFKCSRCSVSLVGSGFFPDRDLILCTDCNNEDWPCKATAKYQSLQPPAEENF